MTHEEFEDKLRKALGDKIPMDLRPSWAKFMREKGNEISLRYEWIKHKGFYKWILECPEVDFGEGEEWIQVWICGFGRVNH